MWNKKAIKIAISVIIGSAIICGGVIYRINDNEMYVETGKSFMLEIEDREQIEDITYQEKLDYLMMSLNEKSTDDGLGSVNFEKTNGKKEELSLEKNTRKFNLFRKGMIEGMISETDKHIVNGMAMMFEDDGDESEFYENFKEESIEKYNDRYIEVMTEYKNVLLEVEKDFELEEYGAKVFTTWLGYQRYEDSIYIKEHIETKYTEDDIEDVLMHLYKEVADAVGDEDLLI